MACKERVEAWSFQAQRKEKVRGIRRKGE
jgi:hypothetical protein